MPDADALAKALLATVTERRRPAAAAVEHLTRRHAVESASEEWLTILDRTVRLRAAQGRAAAQHRQWRPILTPALSPLTPMLPR